ELARHSDIRLTLNVYTHARLHDLAGAVEGLPSLLPGSAGTEAATATATGTDGRRTGDSLPIPYRTLDAGCRSSRAIDERDGLGDAQEAMPQVLKIQGNDDACERLIADEAELPGQDSNLDKENQNLLCYRYTTGYSSP